MKMLRVGRSSPGAFVVDAVVDVGLAGRGVRGYPLGDLWHGTDDTRQYAVTAKLQRMHDAWHHGAMSTDLLTDEACGLRERKKRETRRAINGAALDLVEEKGFAAVTTEEIAARAGVSARTFFNYFPSKEAAVIGTTAEELESYAAAAGGGARR